jgi:hypothetical protein
VVEHLRDVHLGLSAAAAALGPRGLIYVEVPDLERFPHVVIPPFQQFSVEHINYFTSASLRGAAARAGLEQVAGWVAGRRVGPSDEPSICAVFRRSTTPMPPRALDVVGERAVRAYVAACTSCEREAAIRIQALVDAAEPLILWGVGTHALHLFETTSLRQANIVALVDANPRMHGMRVAGMTVAGPENIVEKGEPILICSPLHLDDIVQMARERFGMSNPILTLYGSPAAKAAGNATAAKDR